MTDYTGAYVAHECKQCGHLFVAEDFTKAKSFPPKWRYCPKCAKENNIAYEKQTPRRNRTDAENEKIDKKMARLLKIRQEAKQNIKYVYVSIGRKSGLNTFLV